MIQNYVGLFKEISMNLVTQYPFYLHNLHNTQSFLCLKEKTSASERQSTRFMYWRPLYACMAQVCRLAYKLFDNCGPLTSLDILTPKLHEVFARRTKVTHLGNQRINSVV